MRDHVDVLTNVCFKGFNASRRIGGCFPQGKFLCGIRFPVRAGAGIVVATVDGGRGIPVRWFIGRKIKAQPWGELAIDKAVRYIV